MVAVAVVGDRNITRITGARPLCDDTLDSFARAVARRAPCRLYCIVELSERTQRKKGDPLYVWHVGDGFEHAAGWWTETA